jgi:hypothetical protein
MLMLIHIPAAAKEKRIVHARKMDARMRSVLNTAISAERRSALVEIRSMPHHMNRKEKRRAVTKSRYS